jgi:dTDP-4-dehydrorhamnose reductase
MILVLGATSYIGQAFARMLRGRSECFIPLSRDAFDYSRFELLFDYVRKIKPDLVINAAEYVEEPSSGGGELDRLEMLHANTLLPQTVSRVCAMTQTPWGQVSSGDIYCGAKISHNQNIRIERDLTHPAIRNLFELHPERLHGFTESDEPNFSFKKGPCTFYSGTKALAEEAIRNHSESYIWRLRLPFNEQDRPGNYLWQLQNVPSSHDAINSLSHLEDCVGACLQLWERRAPFGIYNVTNPGAVTIDEIVQMIQRILKLSASGNGLNGLGSRSPQPRLLRSHCVLDGSKLRRAGVELRHVRDALEKSLVKWQSQFAESWKRHPQPEPAAQ